MTDMRRGRFFSYAQNLEDYHLALLAAADVERGFYIDVGGGHAVADNVSFWFYEKGLARHRRRAAGDDRRGAVPIVRPRDVTVEALCGPRRRGRAVPGRALPRPVDHGEGQCGGRGRRWCRDRRAAPAGDDAEGSRRRPCAGAIDFLKIDVEGAEASVLAGNDWTRIRPRVVVVEAVAPWTMADRSASSRRSSPPTAIATSGSTG